MGLRGAVHLGRPYEVRDTCWESSREAPILNHMKETKSEHLKPDMSGTEVHTPAQQDSHRFRVVLKCFEDDATLADCGTPTDIWRLLRHRTQLTRKIVNCLSLFGEASPRKGPHDEGPRIDPTVRYQFLDFFRPPGQNPSYR